MKQRNRYALNDRSAYDGRPVVRPAKSPRTEPARVSVTGGTGGMAVSGGANQTHAVGRAGAGDGARTRRYNTNARTRDGGMPITYYAPMERWRGTAAGTNVTAPARTANLPWEVDGSHEKAKAAGQFAGLRAGAMQRHSILRTTGAVDVIPRVGPVWADDDSE